MAGNPDALCEIARETGTVPLACLFECQRNCEMPEHKPVDGARCKFCGSQDVRWRQQGGKWVLFSLEPGKLHVCPVADDFQEVK